VGPTRISPHTRWRRLASIWRVPKASEAVVGWIFMCSANSEKENGPLRSITSGPDDSRRLVSLHPPQRKISTLSVKFSVLAPRVSARLYFSRPKR
jgi:hypothetical protein